LPDPLTSGSAATSSPIATVDSAILIVVSRARRYSPPLLAVAEPVACAGAGKCQVDALDPQFIQAEELACVAETVAVQIAPHAQARPDAIARTDDTVSVATVGDQVPFRQRLLTIGGYGATCQHGMVAEQLPAVVDAAVAVAVQGKESVVTAHPPGQLRKSVAVMVEVGHGILTERLDAIAVEVED
jgi:hypothetical protein